MTVDAANVEFVIAYLAAAAACFYCCCCGGVRKSTGLSLLWAENPWMVCAPAQVISWISTLENHVKF